MTTTNEHETTADAAEEQVDAAADEREQDERVEEPSVEELRSELAARDERVAALEEQVITLERELSTTVSRYRLALLDAAPEIPGDLVSGSSAEELETSLAKAKEVVDQVRTRLLEGMETANENTEQQSTHGIPAGAPVRGIDDGSAALSTRDKIALGLERM